MKKWKFKALAAAIAIAVSAPASAAISVSGSGNGELFLSVIDLSGSRSYTLDLGIAMDSFLAVPSTPLTYAADALFGTFLSGTANPSSLVWNIGGMDGVGDNRYLTTAAAMPGASGAAPTLTNLALTGLNDNADIYLSNVNAQATHSTLANGSSIATIGGSPDDDGAYAGAAVWQHNWGTKANFSNYADIGDSNLFWLLSRNPAGAGNSSIVRSIYAQIEGAWTLASNGNLTWAAAPAAVPVPAAVWLLGSGLFGLVGVARRRKPQLA